MMLVCCITSPRSGFLHANCTAYMRHGITWGIVGHSMHIATLLLRCSCIRCRGSVGHWVWLSKSQLSICRPTFQQLVEILTEIEVEFRRECHRQRPAMAVGVASNNPSPGRRRSVGFGGVPLPHGAKKPPTRFGSGIDPDAVSFSMTSATPMLRAASSVQSEAFTKAAAVPSSRQS